MELPSGCVKGTQDRAVTLMPRVHRDAGTQVELPTGCVPYSVKKKNDSDKKCPQGCLLTGFDSDTDASKRAGLLGSNTLSLVNEGLPNVRLRVGRPACLPMQ